MNEFKSSLEDPEFKEWLESKGVEMPEPRHSLMQELEESDGRKDKAAGPATSGSRHHKPRA